MGRPAKHMPPSLGGKRKVVYVREHYRDGGFHRGLAARVGMSEGTVRKRLQDDRVARLAFEWGMGEREDNLVRMLHDPNVKNKVAVLFELKARFKWVDTPKPEPPSVGSLVKIDKLVLPAPVKRQEWARLCAPPPVEVEAELVEEISHE